MKKLALLLIFISLFCKVHISSAHATGNDTVFYGGKAKNIILMISDGCGYNHIDATSLYQFGKTGIQIYESFPVRLGMSTHTVFGSYFPESASGYFSYVNEGATDSAAAATAMSTGVKTYRRAIGMDIDLEPLKTVIEHAEEHGMATGVVTTVEFSHATPAGFAAHNPHRENQQEIANEMIYKSGLEVIMGCGAPDFDNSGNKLEQRLSAEEVGGPATFEDLTDDFRVMGSDADADGTPDEWRVIRSRQEFQKLASGDAPARVIGLPFVNETLQQERGGDGLADPYVVPRTETVPTLAEMSRAAINVLDGDEDGFFLMIEGGAVDWASHDNQSGRMIEEEIDFNRAVEAVVSWIENSSSWDETLLIVTGDHECGWLNGPGAHYEWAPLVNNGRGKVPGMHWHSDEHTNQLIPLFAKGNSSGLLVDRIIGTDSLRGDYLDNTAIGDVIIEILSP
jgi:alkaline phosphatase